MCDCIIFQDNKKITHVELKSRSLRVVEVIEKFENGYKILRNSTSRIPAATLNHSSPFWQKIIETTLLSPYSDGTPLGFKAESTRYNLGGAAVR